EPGQQRRVSGVLGPELRLALARLELPHLEQLERADDAAAVGRLDSLHRPWRALDQLPMELLGSAPLHLFGPAPPPRGGWRRVEVEVGQRRAQVEPGAADG